MQTSPQVPPQETQSYAGQPYPGQPYAAQPYAPKPFIEDRTLIRMVLPVDRSLWAIAAGYLGLFALLVVPAPLALMAGIVAVIDIRRNPQKHGMGARGLRHPRRRGGERCARPHAPPLIRRSITSSSYRPMRPTLAMAAATAALLAAAPAAAQKPVVPAVAPATGTVQPPAAPFGFRMGMTLRELAAYGIRPVEGAAGVYTLTRAPNPQAEFESYGAVVSPTRGLCKVVGVGRDVRTSEFGDQVRAEFNRLETLLTNKYGQGDRYDAVKDGSLWTEPQYWMMGLREGDRQLVTFWMTERGVDLPPNLSAIGLETKATTLNTAYLRLSYEFANFPDCRQEIEQRRSDAF